MSGACADWLWVSLPWATFGLGLRDGKVREAAPIARWCIGKDEEYIVAYWRRRGAQIERFHTERGMEQP